MQAKRELEENVRNIIANSDITLTELGKRITSAESKITQLPETERTMVNLQRRFTLNDNIYTYLMQKRATAGMALAANSTDIRMIEPANPDKVLMIAPRKVFVFIIALLFGMLLPAVMLFFQEVLNDFVRTRDELERITNIPILGLVGHSSTQGTLVVDKNLKSVITESFRTIRLNLNYFTPTKDLKMIGITSSISGEGKTFTSINLAAVNVIAGKRTLLILADLRKPKYEKDLGIQHDRGLSTYLSNQATLAQVTQETVVPGLFAISSGPVPPNPAELVGSQKMIDLLALARQEYDMVVVDTPPLGLVSDFFQLAHLMDVNIYLVRHNYTRRGFFGKINEYHRTGKIPNLCIVINDVSGASSSYGYGYAYSGGYGYGDDYSYGDGYFSDTAPRSIKGFFASLFASKQPQA